MIGFESEDVYVRRLRERLQAMGDEELIKFGKYARSLAGIRVSGLPDPYKIQLEEAQERVAQTPSEVKYPARDLTAPLAVIYQARPNHLAHNSRKGVRKRHLKLELPDGWRHL